MSKTLDRTKDIFLDTMLLGNEILTKKIRNTTKKKITVVLSSFRNIADLERILKNLLQQNFTDFEIVVVDDSVDQEIENYIDRTDNKNINYIKKQLGSNSSAKNCAINFSKGEYIVFLEENVTLENNYLEQFHTLATSGNFDIIVSNSNFEQIDNGQNLIIEEIKKYKSDINYNLTAYLYKKKFLDVYNLDFAEDVLTLENLYFKLQTFDVATKIIVTKNSHYKEIDNYYKTPRNEAMVDASVRRLMHVTKKIENFKVSKSYENYLNLLCGYLWLDALRMYDNMDDEKELIELLKKHKSYFDKDSLVNKLMLKVSPVFFANYLNRSES